MGSLSEFARVAPVIPPRSPHMVLRLRQGIIAACVIAAAAMFVSQIRFLGNARVDDAYFTFSVAKNVAVGHGPVYSHGERVEAYSNFLWMVLVALPMVFTRGGYAQTIARVIAIPFLALLGWSVYRLVRRCSGSSAAAVAAVWLLAFDTDLASAWLIGLETVAYTALVTTSLALFVLSAETPRCRPWPVWVAAAAALTRIDGFLIFGFILGVEGVRTFRDGQPRPLRRFARRCLPPVVVYAGWFLWRWGYYGLPLPTTYYAKALLPLRLPHRGMEYVSEELRGSWLAVCLPAAAWLLLRRRAAAALLSAFAVPYLAYVVRVGGDWMPYGRFVMPAVPVMIALLVWALRDVISVAGRVRPLAALAAALLYCAVAARLDHRFLNDPEEDNKVGGVAVQAANVSGYFHAAVFLRHAVPSGGRLVSDYGGVLAYATDATIIEMWGLGNADIALHGDTEGVQPIFGRTCPACYPALDPQYFHVMDPLVRGDRAFSSPGEVIENVWQTNTIGRYIDFSRTFAVGRVLHPATHEALYFLEKRRPRFSSARRDSGDGFVVDYPFE